MDNKKTVTTHIKGIIKYTIRFIGIVILSSAVFIFTFSMIHIPGTYSYFTAQTQSIGNNMAIGTWEVEESFEPKTPVMQIESSIPDPSETFDLSETSEEGQTQ